MGQASWLMPVVWAQATAGSPGGTGGWTANPSSILNTLPMLALRRWFGSTTLSSPESVPTWHGLWLWLGALGAFLLLAAVCQGPGRALKQLFDVPGNSRLLFSAIARMKRTPRMLSIVIGTTVLSWTGSQAFSYRSDQGRDDMVMLTRARALGELAAEQAVLAALTPLRDVASLGSNVPLLIVAVFVLFRASVDVWGAVPPPPGKTRGVLSTGWATAGWCSGALLVVYRLVSIGTGWSDIPLGGCLMVEAFVIPALMLVSDAMLLGWVLCELRDAGIDEPDRDLLDPSVAIDLMPGSLLACLLTLPARYLAVAVMIALLYFLPNAVAASSVGGWLRWFLLGWGVANLQALALPLAGVAGAAAWTPGFVRGPIQGYLRMLRGHGGRIVFAFGAAGLAAGAFSASSYLALMSFPTAPWVLKAADSYAHYFTVFTGLWLLSALVELCEQSLPEAVLLVAPAETEAFVNA